MKIKLVNPSPVKRTREPITIGVPCPRGSVSPDSVFVINSHGKILPVQTTPLTAWPDKSVKWLLCDFLVDLEPNEESALVIESVDVIETSQEINYKHQGNTIEIDTGAARFELNASSLLPFQKVQVNGQDVIAAQGAEIWLTKDKNGRKLPAVIDEISVESTGPLRFTMRVSGCFSSALLFQARVSFYAGSAKTSLELTIHNPRAAKHPGGIWDLGDPSSFLFRELVISLQLSETNRTEKLFKLAPDEPWQNYDENSGMKIYQESSGGKNWDSPNHRNRDAHVPMNIRGYQVLRDNEIIDQGNRCQPVIWAGSGTTGSSVVVPGFWQEFPKALEINQQTIDISLYPSCFPDLHELQGGEQKTHTVYFDFAADCDQDGWGLLPVQITINPQTINESGVFKDITCGKPTSKQYKEFMDAALEGKESFAAKREVVDEYGWRNFGEIYADHEGVFHEGDKPFVSHYNNQYDSLGSFYREYLRTGKNDWQQLAAALADHIVDIDINHTDEDREEYCHGLFWHTDHYLDVGTATHRSVSREHLTQKNPAFCGGGPGAEHCYSTGLMMHYLLTGDSRCRKTVIELADWCILCLKGPQTLLAALLRCKKRITAWKDNRTTDNIWSLFPLSRGTGNCINTCLDAYELTRKPHYLKTSFELIRGTVHPNDNVEGRDLLNAEDCWSYSVFVVAVTKFLAKKRELNEIDNSYFYARDSLLKYAVWMAEHEYPFLDNKEILEYPNETWAAQDFRKSVVFYQASKYANLELRKILLERCRFFLQASFAELGLWDTRFLSRPLALVFQNGWVADTIGSDIPHYNDQPEQSIEWGKSKFDFKSSEVVRRIIVDFKGVLPNTSLGRELAWLKARLK